MFKFPQIFRFSQMFKCSGQLDLLQVPHSSFKVNFFRTGSPSTFYGLRFHILHLCHGHQGWLILQLSFSLAIITLVLPWLINCWQAVSVCPDLRHGKISEMFIPTIYLSPTCPFMTSELLASVCQSGKSSLANASLLASRFGKNRHCWKKCFSPLLCLSQVQSGQSISCDWAATLFFKHVFDAALSIVGVGILQTILRKKQRNGHLEAQDRLADPKLSETIQRGILHLEHLQRQYQGVRQIFRSEIVNCNSLRIDWITRWQLHLQAKSTNWEKNKSKVSI